MADKNTLLSLIASALDSLCQADTDLIGIDNPVDQTTLIEISGAVSTAVNLLSKATLILSEEKICTE